MINRLWNCFEVTGDIHTYLGYKDYESVSHQNIHTSSEQPTYEPNEIEEANNL
ncbi:MAG: YqzL family protein [Cellulosilyticaceae bacterium]